MLLTKHDPSHGNHRPPARPWKEGRRLTVDAHHQSAEADQRPYPIEDSLFAEDEWSMLLESLELPLRQREILRLLVEGQTDGAIANRLGIQVSTVRVHLSRIFRKLGASDRTTLVICVFRRFRDLTADDG